MTAYESYLDLFERELEKSFAGAQDMPQHRLAEAMRYSLLAGGKRIRPVLVLEFCAAAGGKAETALPAALAVEYLHTYSLIHDDLPCMDNDTLRRGKPTNHTVYGEFTAVLAGDALQAEAFGVILRSPLPAQVRCDCAEYLAGAAGIDGICGGQQLDMEGDGKPLTEQQLREIQSRKTGSLISAACAMGAVCGGASAQQVESALVFGAALGSAFQIRDDMLDVLSTEAELGKNIGSDAREGKTTYMSLYGRQKCQLMVERLSMYAKDTVQGSFPDAAELVELVDMLINRVK